eukprot:TRINITY_DN10213_c0_g4_i1.p1 TRINITY_DN10213_c0_g4~~TRINITY_DN10213_c0_g4_i1.p1  ORF type:complete len:236 (+),score=29.83 TRINITY_DN10213_c0_g4_i1:51-758(+)
MFSMQQSTGVLTTIRERRLRVRFSYLQVIEVNVDVLPAKKVTSSRLQDCFVPSDEQFAYHAALLARRQTTRHQLDHVIGEQARTRAELLRKSLNTDDEAHLGFDGLGVVACIKPMPERHSTFDEEDIDVVVSTSDDCFGSECDNSTNLWSFRSTNRSSDFEDRTPPLRTSWSTESGSLMSAVRSFRSALANTYTRRHGHIRSLSFRWTTHNRSRVVPAFDNIMANLDDADGASVG